MPLPRAVVCPAFSSFWACFDPLSGTQLAQTDLEDGVMMMFCAGSRVIPEKQIFPSAWPGLIIGMSTKGGRDGKRIHFVVPR